MSQSNFSRASRFIGVGLVSTLLNYAVFYTLLNFLRTNYLVASATGYILGMVLGFILNNYWTFGYYESVMSKIGGYSMVYLFSLGLSSLFLWLAVHLGKYNPVFMNVISIGISTVTNFIGLNYIIYKK